MNIVDIIRPDIPWSLEVRCRKESNNPGGTSDAEFRCVHSTGDAVGGCPTIHIRTRDRDRAGLIFGNARSGQRSDSGRLVHVGDGHGDGLVVRVGAIRCAHNHVVYIVGTHVRRRFEVRGNQEGQCTGRPIDGK